MSRSVLSLHSRRLTAALLLALVSCALLVATHPAPAGAQTSGGGTLVAPPQTKEQAKAEAEAKAKPAKTTANKDDGSILLWLVIGGVVVLVGATVVVLRDAKGAVGGDGSRVAPGRPLDKDSVGRGVPKQMFEGNSEIGGKQGRSKKRQQGKRQKAARRRNRPAH